MLRQSLSLMDNSPYQTTFTELSPHYLSFLVISANYKVPTWCFWGFSFSSCVMYKSMQWPKSTTVKKAWTRTLFLPHSRHTASVILAFLPGFANITIKLYLHNAWPLSCLATSSNKETSNAIILHDRASQSELAAPFGREALKRQERWNWKNWCAKKYINVVREHANKC